jgi:DNA-directed RNA polymerase subunit M/transcription elongation factor TFIIS
MAFAYDMSTKHCPDCKSLLVAEATLCAACGHEFEISEPPSSSEIVIKAEELFESHLRGRLHRAMRELKLVKVDALRDPRDDKKRTRMRDIEKEIGQLETQLAVQCERTAQARAAFANPQQQSGGTPSEEFRDAQTTKATEAFDFTRLQIAAERIAASHTTAMFVAAQSEKAAEIIDKASGTKICPGCSDQISASAKRCHCGYVLTTTASNDIRDFLSKEELAALRKTI